MITDNIQIENKEVKEDDKSEDCNLITWKSTILNLQSQNRNINKKKWCIFKHEYAPLNFNKKCYKH